MAGDFVPFRTRGGFSAKTPRPGTQGAGARDAVVPIRAPAAAVSTRGLPNHGAPEPEQTQDVPQEPPPPTAEEIASAIAEAEKRGVMVAEEAFKQELVRLEARLERMQSVLDAIQADRKGWAGQARKQFGDLLMGTLERLVEEIPELLEEVLRARVGEIAEQLMGAQDVLLHVHPDDADLAEELLGERAGWEVVEDEDLRGGCIARTSSGEIDGSLDAALESVSDTIQHWQDELGAQDEE